MSDLIEHFLDKRRRKEFFKAYGEVEMLYEIMSPDAFLRPFIDIRDPRRGRRYRTGDGERAHASRRAASGFGGT
jgi:hypothetical protein